MSALYNHDIDLRLQDDLTGLVTKTGRYPIAFGGLSDVFIGELANSNPSLGVPYKMFRAIQTDVPLPVAVKVFRVAPTDAPANERILRMIDYCAALWSQIEHPNIVPLWGVCNQFDRPNISCLVFPYLRNGNITGYLRDRPDIDKLPLLAQTATALSYLHDRSIIHGDLKGSNIMINDKGEACLSDFSRARIFDTHELTTKVSSKWRYKAPELGISYEEDNVNPPTTEGWRWIACELMTDDSCISRPTTATDVWSFAMTVVEILTGAIPFSHIKSDASVILSITLGGRPKRHRCPQINDDLWAMLERCWDAAPNQRPSMVTLSQFFASQVSSVAVGRCRL